MKVTIPKISEHAGFPGNLVTLEISDNCPVCGGKRGEPFGTHSFDGSRRLNCDGWVNPCGHTDKYKDVRKEGEIVKFKQPELYGKTASERKAIIAKAVSDHLFVKSF